MQYMKRAYHFQMEAETKQIKSKIVMTKSFLSENMQPNGYTTTSSLSAIHIYIHISIRKPSQETVQIHDTHMYTHIPTACSHEGGGTVRDLPRSYQGI